MQMSDIQRPLYARFFIGIIVRRDRDLFQYGISDCPVYPRTLYARFMVYTNSVVGWGG